MKEISHLSKQIVRVGQVEMDGDHVEEGGAAVAVAQSQLALEQEEQEELENAAPAQRRMDWQRLRLDRMTGSAVKAHALPMHRRLERHGPRH